MARRTTGEGGLTKKTGYYLDADGQRLSYEYWHASREVSAADLGNGMLRKRVTGSGRTKAVAHRRLAENWDIFHSGEANRSKTRLTGKVTVRTLFDEWDNNNKAGAVSPTMAWKYAGYFRLHILPHIGDRRLDSLREEDLLALFTHTLVMKTDAHAFMTPPLRGHNFRCIRR